jgi:hypothetical protein
MQLHFGAIIPLFIRHLQDMDLRDRTGSLDSLGSILQLILPARRKDDPGKIFSDLDSGSCSDTGAPTGDNGDLVVHKEWFERKLRISVPISSIT